MIILDHNIPEDQAEQLRRWRIHFRQIGFDVGRPEWDDQQETLRYLHTTKQGNVLYPRLGLLPSSALSFEPLSCSIDRSRVGNSPRYPPAATVSDVQDESQTQWEGREGFHWEDRVLAGWSGAADQSWLVRRHVDKRRSLTPSSSPPLFAALTPADEGGPLAIRASGGLAIMTSVRDAIEGVGKAVLESEHEYFVECRNDNHEHIPRVARIAKAVARILRDDHESPTEADAVQESLLTYGKQLFTDEWMSQLEPDEDKARARDEGAAEFDRILSDGQPPAAACRPVSC